MGEWLEDIQGNEKCIVIVHAIPDDWNNKSIKWKFGELF